MMVLKGSSHPWQYFWFVSVFRRLNEIPSYTVRKIKCCKEICTWNLLFLFSLHTFDIFLSATVVTAHTVTSTTEMQSPSFRGIHCSTTVTPTHTTNIKICPFPPTFTGARSKCSTVLPHWPKMFLLTDLHALYCILTNACGLLASCSVCPAAH